MIENRRCRGDLGEYTVSWRRSLALVVGLTLVLVTALVAPPAVAATPASVVRAATPEDVVRAWVEAVNRGDADAAIALYADDAVIEALGQEFRGKPAITRRQRTIIAPILRPRVEIERLTVDGEAVVARLVGENAITRFDGRGPLHQTTTFYVRHGQIQREVGPILDPVDAAWYADAMPRFRATGALPQLLPSTGDAGGRQDLASIFAAFMGTVLLASGIAILRSRRQRHVSSPVS